MCWNVIGFTVLALSINGLATPQCQPEDVHEMVQRAAIVMQSDWTAFPEYAFVERDAETSNRATVVRTHQVFMIEGTDYYMPIAENDQPYSRQQLAQEREKLRLEVNRRSHETDKDRQHRSERYWKERNQTGILLQQFVQAFDFSLVGADTINGHPTCILAALPRHGYQPPNRVAKILTGMQGRLWIDSRDFHWVESGS